MSFPVLGLSPAGRLGLRRVPRGTLVCKPTSPADPRAPQRGSSALGPVQPLSAARPKAAQGGVRSEPRIRGGGRRLRPHGTPERPEPHDKDHTARFPEGRHLHEGGDRFVPPACGRGAGAVRAASGQGPKAEAFLPVIVSISPRSTGPAGTARRPGPGQSPTPGSTWARAGAGRSGRGEERARGGAARPVCPPARLPAGRSIQAAPRRRPGRPPANRARLPPGRTSPGDTRPSATPRLGPGTARAPAPPEPANQRPGMRSPQARSRAGLTRAPPPRGAGARAPPPRAPRRARATAVPRDRGGSCPTPHAGGPGGAGGSGGQRGEGAPGHPTAAAADPPPPSGAGPGGGASRIKAPLVMAPGAGAGG
ncbi:translation initiation factor IF-2-like [Mustela putorius furo]|uniref:Translation initiation factor IF-2-like n=1 Tax=Mustela putorius furo TaxID=9669 RepID=A0A8U0UW26_MUSPF|nr:translation initiation factor IF-2-like [Mustela putorius furo]